MTLNMTKLIVAGLLAVACIIALVVDGGNGDWAVPVLTLLVGYVIGNAHVTENNPIIERSRDG